MADPTNSESLSQWQRTVKKQWSKAAIQPSFNDGLEALLSAATPGAIAGFLTKYKLPLSAFPMLDSYIQTRDLDFSLVRELIDTFPTKYQTVLESLINSPDQEEEERFFHARGGVYLRISPEVHNKKQVHDYIDGSWLDIAAKLATMGYKKRTIRPDTRAEVNETILNLHTDRGWGPAKIADKLNRAQDEGKVDLGVVYTTESVAQTLKRLKQRTNL